MGVFYCFCKLSWMSLGASTQLSLHRSHLFLTILNELKTLFALFPKQNYFSQRAMRLGTAPTSTSVFSLTWTPKMFSPGWRLSLNSFVWNQPSTSISRNVIFFCFSRKTSTGTTWPTKPLTLWQCTPTGSRKRIRLIMQYIRSFFPENMSNVLSIVITLLFSEGCSQWVFGLVGGEGRCVLCDRNPGDQTIKW